MKKAHKKFASALINLIWKAWYVLEIEIALNNESLPQAEKALWKQNAEDIVCKNKVIYLSDNAVLKTKIMRCHHDNLHTGYYT